MDGVDRGAIVLVGVLIFVWGLQVTADLWRPRLTSWARNRQSLAMAQAMAKKRNSEAWEASWRNYECCDPPAYIRKEEEGQGQYLGRRDW